MFARAFVRSLIRVLIRSFVRSFARYTAETVGLIVVELSVFRYAYKRTQTLLDALVLLSLYPLAIGLIAVLIAHTPLE